MAPTTNDESTPPRVPIPGPIIIGAGPSGLAVAASLQRLSVPSLLIERSDSIANLWNHQTYNRLSLHLPKHLCHLPHLPMPKSFPTYPTKSQFMSYLLSYTQSFSLKPIFNSTAVSAQFDPVGVVWRVVVARAGVGEIEYESRWLVVATGENAEPVVPAEEQAMEGFMEKELREYREMLGMSTFELAMDMLKWLPMKMVDRFLVMVAKIMLGNTKKYGLKRPRLGPLELKKTTGKSPVLDIGTLSFIKTGKIKKKEDDLRGLIRYSIVQNCDFFTKEGKPKSQFLNTWKGENGLYCAGFTGKGLLGARTDAVKIASDVAGQWRTLLENKKVVS
ncbi:putative indole-3-pyruvate monooxygenase YUCCA4 [Acorus calamus]|uniref:indole-3-pyruvate monooxygenase n=1 Tax=Acorus calamus TaxID=4465 RepID=A0AAV9D896_ACOCL|nr:putative indole-3-pyruvate monooxygenase YUCCA4 [Acorus calamus]